MLLEEVGTSRERFPSSMAMLYQRWNFESYLHSVAFLYMFCYMQFYIHLHASHVSLAFEISIQEGVLRL